MKVTDIFTIEELLEKINPKIQKHLNTVPYEIRDDVEQELKIKIINSLDNINITNIPGFFDLIGGNQNER
jgi:hypothetical protein